MYILSLTYSIISTCDFLMYKYTVPNWLFSFRCPWNWLLVEVQLLSYTIRFPVLPLNLTCTSLVLLAAVFIDSYIYRLFTFEFPNVMSISHCLHHPKKFIRRSKHCGTARNVWNFYGEWVLSSRPNPNLKDDPYKSARCSLFTVLAAAYLMYWPSPLSSPRGRAMLLWPHSLITE